MRSLIVYRELIATLAIPLVAAALAPAPLVGQSATRPAAVVVEGFLSRARLDPAVGGARMEVRGIGGRVLAALAPAGNDDRPRGLAQRLAVGLFATYAPHDDGRFSAAHYGAVADYHLLAAPLGRRLDPLVSLGAGAFRTRSVVGREVEFTRECMRPTDLARGPLPASCALGGVARTLASTDFALSPAAAVRVWTVPGVAIRLDARDVVVYRGAPRHNLELATGISFVR